MLTMFDVLTVNVKYSSWTDHSQSGPAASPWRTSSRCRITSNSSHGLFTSSTSVTL